jgi:hypothetical protein
MITSERKARMMLSCAIDGGDPAVADLVQNLGAEGAWAKIIEGVLGAAGTNSGQGPPAAMDKAHASSLSLVKPSDLTQHSPSSSRWLR